MEPINMYTNQDTLILLEAGTNTIPYGMSQKLAAQYPYADICGKRQALSMAKSRAHWDSRDEVGDIKIYKDGQNTGPEIIYLIHAFAPGSVTAENSYRQAMIKTSRDNHYVNGAKNDTKIGRHENFTKCMEKLCDHMMTEKRLSQRYIFLLPISRENYESGHVHHVCQTEYVRQIQEMMNTKPYHNISMQFKPTATEMAITSEEM